MKKKKRGPSRRSGSPRGMRAPAAEGTSFKKIGWMEQLKGFSLQLEGTAFKAEGNTLTANKELCMKKAQAKAIIWPEKGLKSRPKSDLDCFICAELVVVNRLRGGCGRRAILLCGTPSIPPPPPPQSISLTCKGSPSCGTSANSCSTCPGFSKPEHAPKACWWIHV